MMMMMMCGPMADTLCGWERNTYRQVHDYITSYSLAVTLILSTGAALYYSTTFQYRIYKQLLAICILWTNLYETNQ